MKLTELYLNRFLYRDTSQNLETKDSAFVSADSTPAEPSPIYSGGAAQDINTGNVQINGAVLEPGTFPQTVLDVSNWGWGQTCAFSSTDLNTVSWGAGTFTSADGTSYAISPGNTGNMAVKTYIYLSLLDSTTAYQTTTTPATAVGIGKVLVAVANPDTTSATYNLSEATQIVGDNILANSINASKITTGQLIVGTNVGLGTAKQNFTAQPTTPYYVGDLWSGGSTGDLKKCITQRLTGAYNAADWDLASKYTDNTVANAAASGLATLITDLGAVAYLDLVESAQLGTTVIVGGHIATSLLTADNILGGSITGNLIQTSSTANTGVKISSSIGGINLYGQNLYIRGDSGSAVPGELYGSIGGNAGYFNINAVSGRNMLIGATNATVFFANDVGTSQSGGGLLGSSGAPWNTIYGGNMVSSNYYEAGGNQRLYYSSSKWQSSSDFKVNGSVNITGNLVFDNAASITINGTAFYVTADPNAAGKYYLRS